MGRFFLCSVLICLIAQLGLWSCGNQADPHVVRVGLVAAPVSIDPVRIKSQAEILVASQLFEGLVKCNIQTGAVEPALAASWTVSPDGLDYSFELDKLAWSDGSPVTAQDVKNSWLRMLDPRYKAPFGWFPGVYISGARDYFAAPADKDPALLQRLRDKVGIQVLSESRLAVHLAQPDSRFLWALGHFSFWVLPSSSLDAYSKDGITKANFKASGPFVPSESRPGLLVLKPNVLYRKSETIKVQELRFTSYGDVEKLLTAWRAGEIDQVPFASVETYDLLCNEPGFAARPDFSSYYYVFNSRTGPARDERVRAALSMSVDIPEMVKKLVGRGMIPIGGIIPAMPGLPALEVLPPRIDLARKLLDEAGYGDKKNALTLDLVYNRNESNILVAEYLAAVCKKNLGVTVNLQGLDMKDFLIRQEKGDFHLIRSGWQDLHLDPLAFLSRFASDSAMNDAGYANPAFDELVSKVRRMSPEQLAQSLPLVREAEQMLVRDCMVLPVLQYVVPTLQRPDVWTGTQADVLGQYDYAQWQPLRP